MKKLKKIVKIFKIKPFISKYNWKRIDYSSGRDDWEKFEENNPTIALNMLYIKKKKIYPTYMSKQNLIHKTQIILVMIPNEEG